MSRLILRHPDGDTRYPADPRGVSQLSPRRWYDTRPGAIAFCATTIAAAGVVGYAVVWCLTWYVRVQVQR